jgi:hypothetical protein
MNVDVGISVTLRRLRSSICHILGVLSPKHPSQPVNVTHFKPSLTLVSRHIAFHLDGRGGILGGLWKFWKAHRPIHTEYLSKCWTMAYTRKNFRMKIIILAIRVFRCLLLNRECATLPPSNPVRNCYYQLQKKLPSSVTKSSHDSYVYTELDTKQWAITTQPQFQYLDVNGKIMLKASKTYRVWEFRPFFLVHVRV